MLGASQGGPGGCCSFLLGFAGINYNAKNKGAGLGGREQGMGAEGRAHLVCAPSSRAGSPSPNARSREKSPNLVSLRRAGLLHTLLEAQGGGTVGTVGGSPWTDEASATSGLQMQADISPFITPGQRTHPAIPAWPPLCPVLCRHAEPTGSCKAASASCCSEGLKPSSNARAWLGGEKEPPEGQEQQKGDSWLEEAWLRKSQGTQQPGHCLSHGLSSSALPPAH